MNTGPEQEAADVYGNENEVDSKYWIQFKDDSVNYPDQGSYDCSYPSKVAGISEDEE